MTRVKLPLKKGKLTLEKDGKITTYDDEEYNGHLNILKNFANAILKGEKLIAPANEAINQVIISNCAYLSSWKGVWVYTDFDETDEKEYFRFLKEKIAKSTPKASKNGENSIDKNYKKKWTTNW